MSLPQPLTDQISLSQTGRKRFQNDLEGTIREIRRLEAYIDKERRFHHRPLVGRPHPNKWYDYEKKMAEAKDAARLKRMEETGKKISALCMKREALKGLLEAFKK